MGYSTGKLAFIFLVATVLAVVFALLLARRYRHAMRTLMSAPAGPSARRHAAADGAARGARARSAWPTTAVPAGASALLLVLHVGADLVLQRLAVPERGDGRGAGLHAGAAGRARPC